MGMQGTKHVYEINGERFLVADGERSKHVRSESYNFDFDKATGTHMRWGATFEDDPDYSPIGPEILDLEITVDGCPNNCDFCYKGNTNGPPINMPYERFVRVVDLFPLTLTQIAFGITTVKANPDFIRMMKYARDKGIIPNFTLSGVELTEEIAQEVAGLVGSVAVSIYEGKEETGYEAVRMLSEAGIKQVNLQLVVSEQTYDFVNRVLAAVE